MVLYLSFIQMASRATSAREEHPMDRNQKNRGPTGGPNSVETQAAWDIRVTGPRLRLRRASIEPETFCLPSKSKPVAFWQRHWLALLRHFSIWI